MKKLMNHPDQFVDEMLEGLCGAHPSLLREGPGGRVVRARDRRPDKVGIVSGGGSGHLPLFTGYVGRGLIDACAIGNVFAGPTVDACVAAITAAESGHGVLRLYGNYGGDRMNFDLAGELLEASVRTTTVLGTDDVASAGPAERDKRRGVAGLVYAYKIAGAAADEGADLDTVTAAAQHAVAHTRSIGVALGPCQIPGASAPAFAIAEDQIEMGMGIHGEPGIWRDRLRPADAIADEMLNRVLDDAPDGAGERVAVMLNSLGATSLEELCILYRRIATSLRERGMEPVRPMLGHWATSMEMAGASLSLLFLDSDLERRLAAPASCPFWTVP